MPICTDYACRSAVEIAKQMNHAETYKVLEEAVGQELNKAARDGDLVQATKALAIIDANYVTESASAHSYFSSLVRRYRKHVGVLAINVLVVNVPLPFYIHLY